MSSTIPIRLIQARVYRANNMREALAGHASIELPSIEFLSDTVNIGGEMEVPTYGQTGSIEMGVTFNTITEEASSFIAPIAHSLVVRGSMQVTQRATGMTVTQAVRLEVTGFTKSVENGTFEPGSATDTNVTFELSRIRTFIDDKKIYEIDKLNQVHEVNGIDYLAKVRADT